MTCPRVSLQSTSRKRFIEALFVQCQVKGEHTVHQASWLNGKNRVTWTDNGGKVVTSLDISEVPDEAKRQGRLISA